MAFSQTTTLHRQYAPSRYIKRDKLEAVLKELFPAQEDFDIRLSNDIWSFAVPRTVTEPRARSEEPPSQSSLDAYSLDLINYDGYLPRFDLAESCQPAGSSIRVDLVDVLLPLTENNGGPVQRTRRFNDLQGLSSYLDDKNNDGYRTRVISISQRNSWAKLLITQEMLRKIMAHHKVMPEFLDVVYSFRRKTREIEEAFCGSVWPKKSGDMSEIAYVFKYPELKVPIPEDDPWRIRQTGVYQQYNNSTQQSTWIVLHPTPESVGQRRMNECLTVPRRMLDLTRDPLLLHTVLFSTHFSAWRTYMSHYEGVLREPSMTALGMRFSDEPRAVDKDHANIQRVHFVESRCLPLTAIFRSFSQTLSALSALNTSLPLVCGLTHSDSDTIRRDNMVDILSKYASQTSAYEAQIGFLTNNIRSTAQLLSNTLNFKYQGLAQQQSEYVVELTSATLKDSSAVRVITIITLLYLPSTFVATIFGMDFFNFGGDSRLQVSPQLWIFFAFAAPLTMATIAWYLRQIGQRRNAAATLSAKGKPDKLPSYKQPFENIS
ncbi:MAG: hypothetical protein M1819_001475 [Sarea resinae]|nr:MAG: hypothetical protein M1819_001475 [Sarea resinae]